MGTRPDEHKICFITCVTDAAVYNESLASLRRLIVPDGMTVESRAIEQAASMAEGYEAGRTSTDAKYKIYLHQDVQSLAEDFLVRLIRAFREDAELGLLGVIGCEALPTSGCWWESNSLLGSICDEMRGELSARVYRCSETCQPAAALDGCLLATQYDVPWRADLFEKFDFYDISACMEYRRHGWGVAVLPQSEPLIAHFSGQEEWRDFLSERRRFVRVYAEDAWDAGDHFLSVVICRTARDGENDVGLDLLEQALAALSHEVIFVDDASGKKEIARSGVRALTHAEPRGIAASFAEGVAAARGDRLLLLMSDVLLPQVTLRRLFAALAVKGCALAGPLSRTSHFCRGNFEGPRDYTDGGTFLESARELAKRGVTSHGHLILDAGCLLLTRAAWDAIGGFTAALEEDELCLMADFCLRGWRKGLQPHLAEDALVHRNAPAISLAEIMARRERGRAAFEKLWGFELFYSTNMRADLISLFDAKKDGMTVLEAGCACGADFLAIRAVNATAEFHGIELNAHSAAIAQQFASVEAMDIETLDHPAWEGKFDLVLMGDILEHLRDPWQTVRNMYRVQKPGGQIVISVPNITHFSIFAEMLANDWQYEPAGILDRTHLRFFTKKTARALLEQAGYRVTVVAPIVLPPRNEAQTALVETLASCQHGGARKEDLFAFQWRLVGVKEGKESKTE